MKTPHAIAMIKKMAIAGDWLKGPRVEQAFDSGTAAYLGLC